jgi:hypothetical protein
MARDLPLPSQNESNGDHPIVAIETPTAWKAEELMITIELSPEDLQEIETKHSYLPTLTEIQAECREIQSHWTELERRRRAYGGSTRFRQTVGAAAVRSRLLFDRRRQMDESTR